MAASPRSAPICARSRRSWWVWSCPTPLPLATSPHAIPRSIQGHLKTYPSLLARTLEPSELFLEPPHGCGDHTLSSTSPNLLLLKALKEQGFADEQLSARAMKSLRA